MNKQTKIIIIAVIAIIIILGVYFLIAVNSKKIGTAVNKSDQSGQEKEAENKAEVGEPPKSATKSAVPENIKIPEVGEETESHIAVPVSVSEAAPGVEAKFRAFNINAENDSFNPSTVIVKKGDTVHINFLAVDKDYDITFPDYGMMQTAKKGQTKILEFQAVAEGKFAYYCEACGGLNSKALGYIIVAL